MSFDSPQSRNEAILQNILGADNSLLEPESRIEELLQAILVQGALETASFSLVNQIEVTDATTNNIELSDLDYTKVFIRARIAAGEMGTVQSIVTVGETDYNCGWWAENTSGGVADTFARIENDMFFSEYGSQMTSLTASGNNTTLARREISWGQLVSDNITGIQLTSSKYFPEGTIFYIYAVPTTTSRIVSDDNEYLVVND